MFEMKNKVLITLIFIFVISLQGAYANDIKYQFA